MWNKSRKFKPLVMYVAEFAPIDMLVFVVVLVDDFFAIKLFHYHVPIVKKAHIAKLGDTWAIYPLV